MIFLLLFTVSFISANMMIREEVSSNTNRVNLRHTSSLEICKQPPSRGNCTDHQVKWFYNSSSEVWHRFWYGGCWDNDNRFDNNNDCRLACLHRRAPEPGPGEAFEQHVRLKDINTKSGLPEHVTMDTVREGRRVAWLNLQEKKRLNENASVH